MTIFKDKKAYKHALDKVYDFHKSAYETILDYLRKHGDRVITDEDNKLERWRFSFLDTEGAYDIKAIRLNKKNDDFYLDAVGEDGGKYHFDWQDINYDMCIEEMLVELVLNDEEPDEVERLADAYNALTCAEKDRFLRLTGNE